MSPHPNQRCSVLALVTDAYGGTGGIAQYNRDFIEALVSHPSISSVTVLPRVISRESHPVPARVEHRASSAGSKLDYIRGVASVAKPRSFDVVICGHVNLLPVAYIAAKRIGAAIVLLTFGAEVWEEKNFMLRYLIAQVDSIVSISRFTEKRMRAWVRVGPDKVVIIPNAIDLETYANNHLHDPSAELKRDGSPFLLTLGRMDAAEQAKGFDQVMEALPSILTDYPDLLYCAAGDGTDRPRLMEKARTLGIERHVRFPGYVPESEKIALFRMADLYVMPSRLEGFGYVFLEALACGVPVIASTIDGSREAIMNGAWGAVVDPDNQHELITAIRQSLSNPKVPDSTALEYFSKDQFHRRVHSLIDRVLTAH